MIMITLVVDGSAFSWGMEMTYCLSHFYIVLSSYYPDVSDTIHLSGELTMHKRYYIEEYNDWLGHTTIGEKPLISIKKITTNSK